jgi:hypothetical protein
MIYLDQRAEPSDIARTLGRELGPQACIAIADSLVKREPPQILIDEVNDDA